MTQTSPARTMADHVDALEQTLRSTLRLAESMQEGHWRRTTDCPGWSVADQVAHLVALERQLAGDAPPPPLAAYPEHVRGQHARAMENGVAARRGRSGAQLTDELRETLDRRFAGLRAEPLDPSAPAVGVAGQQMTLEQLLKMRVFDCWAHEQDIRRATGRPGNLDGPAAEVVRDQILGALPFLFAKRVGATAGQSVRVEVEGELAATVTVGIGADGRAALRPAEATEPPTATVRMGWETLARLACGRVGADEAEVEVTGDVTLARRVLANLTLTP